MKMKIRGLVFTGFAAAVFASSALDAIGAQPTGTVVPPTQMTNDDKPNTYEGTLNEYKDDLKATVTSKYYTNETFQERIAAADKLSEKSGVVDEHAAFVGWHYGQNGEDTEWVKLEGQPQMQSSGSATVDAPYLDISHDATNHKHYVGLQEVALTYDEAGNGQQGWEKIDAAGQNGAADNVQKRLTTAKAVYDFVKHEVGGANIDGNIDYHTQKVAVLDSTFAGTVGVSSPYRVTEQQLSQNPTWREHVHYELIVPDTVVTGAATGVLNANSSTGVVTALGATEQTKFVEAGAVEGLIAYESNVGTTTITGAESGNGKIPTVKNVYDFVTQQGGNFQRKLRETAEGNNPADNKDAHIGVLVNAGTDLEPDWQSEWRPVYGTGYIVAGMNGAKTEMDISINDSKVAVAPYNVAGATGDDLTDLVTVGVLQGLPGAQQIPDTCVQDGVHCALVTSYVPAVGNVGDDNYVPAKAVAEWTVMAPDDSL